MSTSSMKVFLIFFLLTASASFAQKYPEGIWQGYDGEWKHVSQQLVALAEATPADKFAWRPAPGVRSTSEVYMHIVEANFYLLSVTGPKMPADLPEGSEKKITSKPEVIAWLEALAGGGERSSSGRETGGSTAQSAHRRSRRHGRRDVSTHPRPRERTYGTTNCVCPDDRRCSALVEELKLYCLDRVLQLAKYAISQATVTAARFKIAYAMAWLQQLASLMLVRRRQCGMMPAMRLRTW